MNATGSSARSRLPRPARCPLRTAAADDSRDVLRAEAFGVARVLPFQEGRIEGSVPTL